MQLSFTPTDIAGGQYHRANKVIFSNPIAAKADPSNRSVLFIIEQVTNTANGGHVTNDNGFINTTVNDEDRDIEIPLIDFKGNVVGKQLLGDVTDMTLLYINSFMIHIASKQNRLAE